jgi:hypothetical protein
MRHLQGAFGAVAISTGLSATGAELFTIPSEKPIGGEADAGSQYITLAQTLGVGVGVHTLLENRQRTRRRL